MWTYAWSKRDLTEYHQVGDALDVEQQRMADCTGQSRNTVYIVYRLKKKIKKFLGCMVYAVGAKLVSNLLPILATAECGHLKVQSSHPAERRRRRRRKTAKTSLCWLAGHSWFKMDVVGLNWSSWCSAGWSAGLPDWPAKAIKTVLKPMYKSARSYSWRTQNQPTDWFQLCFSAGHVWVESLNDPGSFEAYNSCQVKGITFTRIINTMNKQSIMY